LKRVFVLSENVCLNIKQPKIAKVVPWRPIAQYKWRMGVPNKRSGPIYMNLSRLVGLAYDTLGIEPTAYIMLRFVYKLSYKYSVALEGKAFVDRTLPEQLAEDRKYLLKLGMQEIPTDFPTYEQLMFLNYYDRNYHKPEYNETRSWQESVLEVELY